MHCALHVDVCGLFSSPVAPGKAQWREGQEEDTPAETWAVGSSAHCCCNKIREKQEASADGEAEITEDNSS